MSKFMVCLAILAVLAGACNMGEEEHEHDWTIGEVIQASTCSTRGQFSYICRLDRSHVAYDEMAFDPYNHVVTDWTEITTATCSRYGRRDGVCTLCSVETFESLDKLPHRGTYETIIPPGCVLPGREIMTCNVCGERVGQDIRALGHNWQKASRGRICTRCLLYSLI